MLDGAEAPERELPENDAEDEVEIQIDASQSMSSRERLRTLDFEQMSTAEMAEARRMIAKLRLPVKPILSRRTMAGPRGLVDPARTLRQALRHGRG